MSRLRVMSYLFVCVRGIYLYLWTFTHLLCVVYLSVVCVCVGSERLGPAPISILAFPCDNGDIEAHLIKYVYLSSSCDS